MENFPKRGRPRKIPRSLGNPLGDAFAGRSPEEQNSAREYFADAIRTDRSRNNAYYADIAREVIGAWREQVQISEDPVLAAKIRLVHNQATSWGMDR